MTTRLLSCLAVLLFIAACNEQVTLVQDLDQKNTNAILFVLAKNGISAQKQVVEKQQEKSWVVTVASGDEVRAREILMMNQLPKERQLGLSGVCKDAGLIPTPKTEKCRELLALKGEIINSLESIQGVVSADVVLNVPEKEDFPDENAPPKRPTASVVIEVSAEFGKNITESKVQQFVANAVTGMDVRDVAVIISMPGQKKDTPTDTTAQIETGDKVSPENEDVVQSADMTSVGGLSMDEASAKKFKIIAVFFLFVFVLLSAGLIAVLFQMARLRQKNEKPMNTLPEPVANRDVVNT
ncbi:hypothetical protein K1X76_08330 [bacterium]|nr:hypothetical protein [bacterium]